MSKERKYKVGAAPADNDKLYKQAVYNALDAQCAVLDKFKSDKSDKAATASAIAVDSTSRIISLLTFAFGKDDVYAGKIIDEHFAERKRGKDVF